MSKTVDMTKWYPKFRAAFINPAVWDLSLQELKLDVYRGIFADKRYLTAEGNPVSFAIVCKKATGTRALRVAHTFAKALVTSGVQTRCVSIVALAKSIREMEDRGDTTVDDTAAYLGHGMIVIYDFDDASEILSPREFLDVCSWLQRHYYRGGGLVLVGIHQSMLSATPYIEQDLSDIIATTFVQVEVAA